MTPLPTGEHPQSKEKRTGGNRSSTSEILEKETNVTIIAETTDSTKAPAIQQHLTDYMTPQIEAVQSRLNEHKEQIAELEKQRQSILLHACAELAAEGIDAHVIDVSSLWRQFTVGDRGLFTEEYDISYRLHPVEHQLSFHPVSERWSRDLGPYKLTDWLMQVVHGTYTVVFRDGDEILIANTTEPVDLEAAHRRAVARLRSLARSEAMGVRTRDREVELLSPSNTVMHTGDVVSAFKWLMGIEEVN